MSGLGRLARFDIRRRRTRLRRGLTMSGWRVRLGQELERGVGRDVLLARPAGQLLAGALSDAPRRYVDHPQQADGLEGIVPQAEVGQEVLDLPPLVEAGTAHQAIGGVAAGER